MPEFLDAAGDFDRALTDMGRLRPRLIGLFRHYGDARRDLLSGVGGLGDVAADLLDGSDDSTASKSGLIGLTQALAAEFGPRNVRVNAVLPGAVDTAMYREMDDTPEQVDFITGLYALKRVATPEELARSVLYLACDDSAFVTGTASLIDGGASITRT
jgi:NAD(P)-dependent dehydrogenase (short-subunit alcohol dehydrogenase family)